MGLPTGCGALLLFVSSVTLLFLLVHPATTTASAHVEDLVTEDSSQGIPLAATPLNAPESQASGALDVDDDEESEYEEAPEDLPIPSAFAHRPPVPSTSPLAPKPKPAATESASMTPDALLSMWHVMVTYRVIDISAAVLFLIVVVIAIKGKAENTEVATEWMKSIRELLAVQFASVADGSKGALIARSYNSFEFFCSGRRNCMFMLSTLDCVPRQCLWRGNLLRQLLDHKGDLVTLEFILPEAGEGMIVNICKRQEQRSHIEASWDIMEFCKVRHANSISSQLPDGFVLLADTQEAAERLLESAGLQKHLSQLAPYLKCIYTSDLCTNTNPALTATIGAVFGSCAAAVNKPKRVLRMSYYLPENNDAFDNRLPIVVACKLVDALASIRLSDSSRESVRKLRLAYEKEQQKHRRKEQQEAAEKRRIDKKKEQERALESLPEEQRRKAQEAHERKAIREQRKEQRQGIKVVRV